METIGDNIWRIEGRKPGPHLLVLGGVHGNERTGIQAVRWLLERFGVKGERLAEGTLTVALGNPEAVRRNTRGSAPHRDLNRCFKADLLAAPKTYEEKRAAILATFIAEADVLVDLHAVNTPSKPFVVATEADPQRLELGAAFPCDTYVVAPDEIIAGSTDGWIGKCGGYGIGYESGHMKDLTRMAEVKAGIDRIMRKLGLMRGHRGLTPVSQSVIAIEEPLILEGESFTYAADRGKTSFEPVAKGDILGLMDGKPLKAPFSGLLLFPKPKRLHKPGSPVGFLAVEEK
ncbi:MAG TPA: succinylglutamate desuccinylase/aspartoacylase family protein [Candidatus Eisenbacteria bacterium]|nr:succinylglutamate desuccinylase/aspartoacylase family protein [Candidatus Eisenbacteria bacterium]